VANVEFRRALAHAIDRQEIVDTLAAGMSPVPQTFLSPNQAAYREIEAAVLRYDYDLRRSAELLERNGYQKGADGTYRSEAGRRLELEVRSGPAEQAAKPASVVAGYWQRMGADATAVRLSPQQTQDAQYAATFPAFAVYSRPADVGGLRFLHSSEAPMPSNNFRVQGSGNTSRYMSPEFDALLDTYFRTVPLPDRIGALGRIIYHIADRVTLLGLHYNPQPGAVSNRLAQVSREWPLSFITWNAHEWDLSPS
jgi:ABC-type transport system substrate-binding protein